MTVVNFPQRRPTLDELIEAAAKLAPGPEAWAPIFHHYPELSLPELVKKFRQSGERALREADALKNFWRQVEEIARAEGIETKESTAQKILTRAAELGNKRAIAMLSMPAPSWPAMQENPGNYETPS
jgi:hypothetical protein